MFAGAVARQLLTQQQQQQHVCGRPLQMQMQNSSASRLAEVPQLLTQQRQQPSQHEFAVLEQRKRMLVAAWCSS